MAGLLSGPAAAAISSVLGGSRDAHAQEAAAVAAAQAAAAQNLVMANHAGLIPQYMMGVPAAGVPPVAKGRKQSEFKPSSGRPSFPVTARRRCLESSSTDNVSFVVVPAEDAGASGAGGAGNKERENTSLGWLTSRFIEFLERCPEGAADLAVVCEHLGVPKRRMYDITNVLEGVGLLDKRGKNTVVWRGMAGAGDSAGRGALAGAYRRRLEELDEESLRLDAALAGATRYTRCCIVIMMMIMIMAMTAAVMMMHECRRRCSRIHASISSSYSWTIDLLSARPAIYLSRFPACLLTASALCSSL